MCCLKLRPCYSSILKVRLVQAPVEYALADDVVESDGDKAQVNQHLPKAEKPLACDRGKFAVDDRPGHHEDHFHIEQDEEHGNHIEAHAESAASIAHRYDAALVGGQFGGGVAMPANKKRGRDHRQADQEGGKDLHRQRQILPVIGDHACQSDRVQEDFTRLAGTDNCSEQTGCWFEIRYSSSSRQGKPGRRATATATGG